MNRKLLLAAASMAVMAVPVPASSKAGDSQVQKVTVACPEEDPASKPANHVDFSGTSGLEFDPLAPGGARPSMSQGNQSVGVDPMTVTLFPPTEAPPSTTTTGKTEDHEEKPCP